MVMPSKVAEAMSDVNLTCYSFGDAIRHIWFKNGRILPQSQVKLRTSRTNRGLTLQESILLLRQVTPADGGKYVCKVNTSFAPGYQHNATAILQVTTGRFYAQYYATLFYNFLLLYEPELTHSGLILSVSHKQDHFLKCTRHIQLDFTGKILRNSRPKIIKIFRVILLFSCLLML